MKKVQCYECGKSYDFDVDDFCPKCGAFNQPKRSARIGADGAVIRVDGLNERGHKGSFVHRELHAEDRIRRAAGLEQDLRKKAAPKTRQKGEEKPGRSGYRFSGFVTVIFFLILMNLLRIIFGAFF